ncbi:glycosyltransferase family 2 protein [Bacteroides eggerthii]|jgi:GT2 family glycosyltransferase|uniref:Lipopolysaccharide biosynthesis glycosyltransferase n=1 Tax=Bacteroides eggerthii TaxID=28111 RepID=A0A380YQP3_9BACE|nr:glycosyltransferase family 2 protein [Bacteroides eggerthii]EEC54176.1 glycosyltransferase, group 2 family protein [Bacteroides eggerthii DSM 20697]QRQ48045.1 glycosyltransferase family 2 protein [Bacteroides eggerthii]UWN86399.1 glycosyltransferase family 2 protein [Bacteroides eggerthii]SUV28762.1 lipopolysaccharide biosynthesis glycosyltransferase [Bacteroides eggerthii]
MLLLTATIVTYKNNPNQLLKTINSFLTTRLDVHLYIVDNSPEDDLGEIFSDDRITYIYMDSNNGFGSGHNVILRCPEKMGKYHLILNPDIYFEVGVLERLCDYMDANIDVGNVMPRVVYPNGELQYLCKLLPSPLEWVGRIFIPVKKIKERINYSFEMRFANYNEEMNVPYLSGCFMFLRKSVIEDIGVFDEGIFMYGEDTDLNRRIYKKYRTMYYPMVTITHAFERGSHKSLRLFWIHVKAAIYYLNKWGWFFDKERREINRKTKYIYNKSL